VPFITEVAWAEQVWRMKRTKVELDKVNDAIPHEEHRRRAHFPHLGLRIRTEICDTWPVRCQTYGTFPGIGHHCPVTGTKLYCHCPVTGTKLLCLLTEARVCEHLAQGCLPDSGTTRTNPWPLSCKSDVLTIIPYRPQNWLAHLKILPLKWSCLNYWNDDPLSVLVAYRQLSGKSWMNSRVRKWPFTPTHGSLQGMLSVISHISAVIVDYTVVQKTGSQLYFPINSKYWSISIIFWLTESTKSFQCSHMEVENFDKTGY